MGSQWAEPPEYIDDLLEVLAELRTRIGREGNPTAIRRYVMLVRDIESRLTDLNVSVIAFPKSWQLPPKVL
jgi:hypothetical protein